MPAFFMYVTNDSTQISPQGSLPRGLFYGLLFLACLFSLTPHNENNNHDRGYDQDADGCI